MFLAVEKILLAPPLNLFATERGINCGRDRDRQRETESDREKERDRGEMDKETGRGERRETK